MSTIALFLLHEETDDKKKACKHHEAEIVEFTDLCLAMWMVYDGHVIAYSPGRALPLAGSTVFEYLPSPKVDFKFSSHRPAESPSSQHKYDFSIQFVY